MISKTQLILAACAVILFATPALAQDSGQGVDSQVLWPSPGPSAFPTLESSDIVGHKDVTFAAVFGYSRQPLPQITSTVTGESGDVIENAFYTDFLWAFGIADWLQLGLVLPVVLDQQGDGMTPIGGDPLASSALRDLRFNVKTRLLGGKASNPDTRGLGLALDLGLGLPTGDEKNFAGENGVVFFPTAVIDYHKCMVSAAVNLGARFRFEDATRIAPEFEVGHQATFGFGLTGHLMDRRFLISGQGTGLIEMDGFDRLGVDIIGGLGYIPDESRAITIWLSGGLGVASEEFVGAPKARALIGLTYAPGSGG